MQAFILLRDGPTLPDAAVLLALDLEREGHALSVRDGKLIVTNGSTLSPTQRAGVKQHLADIVKLLAYAPPEPR